MVRHSQICLRIYNFCLKKHTHTNKDETKEEKKKTKEIKEEKEKENVVVMNSICEKPNRIQ